MSKLLSQPKLNRRTHKRVFGFSDWEIDVAKQLLQFSRDYEAKLRMDKLNRSSQTHTKHEDGDHKTKKSPEIGATDFSLKHDRPFEDDEDAYPKRVKQRFRPIQHIYMSTQPILDGTKAKKAGLT